MWKPPLELMLKRSREETAKQTRMIRSWARWLQEWLWVMTRAALGEQHEVAERQLCSRAAHLEQEPMSFACLCCYFMGW